ncbi:hypothetical protein N483_14220 [Pseudoalteromonas luteoviolacea NCIMB 1944]|uniref:Sulfatase-modifying factor enzyme-like domain-containing protein n=2 Tax=Pseudoalteromonas TaxID=53246 RepID=V4HRQ3_PSEL2|nr:hypothetical protein PL2TA16_01708 [Pseudoalteromonas luteoviolacea 2ta16]KZN41823.1 hypothetical protein N483_14220 [Pseudoalteromonas luteoviolacea NCIMB 1944]
MGCSAGDLECEENEKPAHPRKIPRFKMMKHELTWEMYLPCIEAGVCDDNRYYRFRHQMNEPVAIIRWNDITEQFLPWLNQNQKARFRLPSEAEWEYAARAGSESKYSWGNTRSGAHANGNNRALWPEDGNMEIGAVMSYMPNAFGLYDMHGNVWEWVQDCWHEQEYQNKPSSSGANELRGEKYEKSGVCKRRVTRGGAWQGKSYRLRSSFRYFLYANSAFTDVGFRLVQEPVEGTPSQN